MNASGPRVFLSYAHEHQVDGHVDRALSFAQALRRRGVHAVIDQFVEHDPPASWPRWMLDEIKQSDFVLCLVSPRYKLRIEDPQGCDDGYGVKWEGAVITNEIYLSYGQSRKFIAVVLEGCSHKDIPDILFPVGAPCYIMPGDQTILYRRLTNRPRVVPAPIGPRVDPPPGGFSVIAGYFDT